ncbi:E3 ubiquitin-protein ligase RNF123-like [Macrosteles quadrilineatus]|uniref:E3 ubiquitin-protein ligase RNF123-like n=1 Tax=Macrosteles quadrilineatus TaxID=74068 RepID=UPI0023E1BB7B|nr:E3 ubiquitin-protein ligase RNF123-like [Macrosteles quadrilineatus]
MKRKEIATEESSTSNLKITFKDQSDIGVISLHVFGTESPKTILAVDPLSNETTDRSILENTRVWVHKVLDGIEPPMRTIQVDNRPGRLGLPQVRFDSTAQVGTLVMSADRLCAQAQSNFSSVKANVCFYSGKWQYELHLESKGVMQLGWAMAEADFSPDTGVGDSIHSFAYDGNRLRKWNLVTSDYGEAWQVGDIIGCTIDLDQGDIHFYRNGRNLGKAFSSLVQGPGCVYYPAVSLAFEEKIQANFGALPFKYPVDGYEPAQQPPAAAVLRTNQLLHWLFRASTIPKYKQVIKKTSDLKRKESPEVAVMMICEILVKPLSELLGRPYIVEACLVPFLQDITAVTVDKKSLPAKRSLDKLNFICDTFNLFYEPDDLKDVINAVCKCLLQKCSQTSVSLDYSKQKSSLVLLVDLLHNRNVRMTLLKLPGFIKIRLPEFMDLRVIDVTVLKQLVPTPWWPSDEVFEGKQLTDYEDRMEKYLNVCETIKNKTIGEVCKWPKDLEVAGRESFRGDMMGGGIVNCKGGVVKEEIHGVEVGGGDAVLVAVGVSRTSATVQSEDEEELVDADESDEVDSEVDEQDKFVCEDEDEDNISISGGD